MAWGPPTRIPTPVLIQGIKPAPSNPASAAVPPAANHCRPAPASTAHG